MANEYFVVKNGLEVGSVTIDATTGNVSVPSGSQIAIGSVVISGDPVVPASFGNVEVTGTGSFTDVTVSGNLTVSGTSTTVNTATLDVADINITVAKNATNAAQANGAGLTAAGANATITYSDSDDRWNMNKALIVATVYGNLTGNVTGNVTGTAGSLATTRYITLSGDATGNVGFNGSANVDMTVTVADNSHNHTSANISDATALNTANMIVKRGASGEIAAGAVTGTGFFGPLTGNVTGNADTATRLATTRYITLTGDVTGNVSFDGSGNAAMSTTIAANSVALGADTTGNYVASLTNGSYLTGANGGSEGASLTLAVDATSTNTASKVVARDANGSFAANVVTAGSVSTTGSVSANTITTTSDVTVGGNLFVNGTTATVNATTLDVADLNITVAKNAATAAAANGAGLTVAGANATFTYTSADDRFNLNKNLNVGTVYGALSGNASTATRLATTRYITLTGDVTGNVSFDGSGNAAMSTTIAANSVALGTDTTGNYVASIANGSYITGGAAGSEGAALTLAVDATSANTASKVVARDASGNFSAGTITATSFSGPLTGAVTGNASTASAWQTTRYLTLTGDVTGNVAVSGSGNMAMTATIAADSVALGTDTTGNYVASIANGSYITGGAAGSEGAALTLAVDATSANTASKVVARDASGNFSAGTITATTFSGAHSGSGASLTSIPNGALVNSSVTIGSTAVSLGSTVTAVSGITTLATTGDVTVGGNLFVNGTTATVNATTLDVADLNITVAKNAATAAAANGAGLTVAGANATLLYGNTNDNFTFNKRVDATSFVGPLTGNASTATTLQTARTINGVSFNGSANITVAASTTNALTLGTYLTGTSFNGGTAVTAAVDATSANTASKVVARDASGNFSAGTITASLTGNCSGTANNITAYTINQNVGTANSPTFAGITLPSITKNGTTGVGDIGQSGNTFGTVYATATSAKYADLAEKYVADKELAPGTVVCFGGDKEVMACLQEHSTSVAGVVSTKPAYVMNAECEGEFVTTVAFTGRVPCKVIGPVRKGDMMVSAGNGAARAEANPKVGAVIGKALENFDGETGTIEVVVGK